MVKRGENAGSRVASRMSRGVLSSGIKADAPERNTTQSSRQTWTSNPLLGDQGVAWSRSFTRDLRQSSASHTSLSSSSLAATTTHYRSARTLPASAEPRIHPVPRSRDPAYVVTRSIARPTDGEDASLRGGGGTWSLGLDSDSTQPAETAKGPQDSGVINRRIARRGPFRAPTGSR